MITNLDDIKTVVIKIGTNTLNKNGKIDDSYLKQIAAQISILKEKRITPLIVTSGAIGFGALELGITNKVTRIDLRQACAAIGQPILMNHYKEAFKSYNISIGQILITKEVLNQRKSYLNLKTAVEALLKLDVVPIFNENDNISTQEIGKVFGDNDRLSAHIASKMDADLLIILSDIDALYDKNPKVYDDATPIHFVTEVTADIMKMAKGKGSTFSTGGMLTKLKAVKIADKAGCQVILANGREENILPRIINGEEIGTHFLAKERISNKKRWIINSTPKGKLTIDEGAIEALRRHKSLLPSGVINVEGIFDHGDVISVNDCFKIITNLTSEEIKIVMGMHSSEIKKALPAKRRDDIARPEDIVDLLSTP
ncbi:glutamate 5-kinase [Spirochaeta cellobiosiphila]|uniref:glutamate 5-kinase n=1 Tax=Spirochaeta cellobiosiphila TaxID=504483 RepID=UPI0003FDFCEE|nr:glutamate 5-kinase [Spirochaeta cellobiosiphila]